MDSRISRIRQNEKKSHTEVYTKEKLYDSNTWLRKPIKTVEELVPLFADYEEVRILDLGAGVGRNSIFKDWKILKKNVVQQNYEIPRENIRSSLSTNVVTFVARKNN
ncbi:hypothetical protein SAMN02910350_02940 [Pseudobutyrivibrio xylanivorans]|uniref:Class I SAM-dependent methyltransferase n=2 Tax=Pseudobutyrivibrio xylanivorans TaxID=185007 RepID=A0A1G5S5S5_PSEXY|nr:hypothetical protein SAMN02910350_02940 [Pseudobutyrivibrio xylanivorans]